MYNIIRLYYKEGETNGKEVKLKRGKKINKIIIIYISLIF